jgi:acetylornithine deacetylase/succinyl-diaminopimelate desuccinylase-like protein
MDILNEIRAICARPTFREEIADLLERLCAIDTSPGPDLARLRENEQRVFDVIRTAQENLHLLGATIVQKEISPAIQRHPAFSAPYYAPGTVTEIYEGRGNLLFLLDREPAPTGASGIALNAHIDTVPPHIPPVRVGDLMTGRGTADDKGNVVAIVGALRVLAELEQRGIVHLKNKLTAMFVIDEETGGNGSLALAVDRTLKERYDSMLVMECTGNRLHPANRGAVFIRCEGRLAAAYHLGPATPSLLEAFALAILALLDEGEAIRQESDHPLFPHRPVQTCTGILGPFGVHPSAICGEVGFELVFHADDGTGEPENVMLSGLTIQGPQRQDFSEASPPRGRDPSLEVRRDALHPVDPLRVTSRSTLGAEPLADETLRAVIERGITRYIARYGDKTQVIDPATGVRKVERHYDLAWQETGRCTVTIHGATGHMGSLPQNDAAIAKWAYVMRELIEARRARELAFSVAWPGADPYGPSNLVFEGAQGFLPTHMLEDVKVRCRDAFLTAIQRYLVDEGLPPDSITCEVSFDKLHNDAFAGDPNSETVLRALRTAVDIGLAQPDEPVRGWEVSCDARLFAREYPDLPVLTFGAGHLEHAHSERELLGIAELLETISFTALFVLRETGDVL